jgi:hypothetical protein
MSFDSFLYFCDGGTRWRGLLRHCSISCSVASSIPDGVIEVVIIIIIVFINYNWVVTRWQWLFYMYTNMK